MLKELELKCFQQHEDLTITFAGGLNAIKGDSESGKSTLLRGIVYALFGTKALSPLSFAEDLVTWGRKESELRVRLVIGNEEFVRSKAGAEVYRDGSDKPFVTGQNEVTAHAAKLLGADAKTAAVLMLANQNDMAGAITEGPTKVSAIMGQLADFAVIDRLLESAQANLLLGGDKPVREKLEAAEAELADAIASQPVDGSVLGLHNDIQVAEHERDHHQALLETTLQPALDGAQAALEAGERTLESYRAAFRAVGAAEQALERHREALTAAKAKAGQQPDAERMQRLRAGILAAEAERPALEAWAAFQKLPKYPEAFWEGTHAAFLEELEKLRLQQRRQETADAELKGEINVLKTQRITSGKCPTCGHAARSDEHVAQHNAEVEAKIAPLTDKLLGNLKELRSTLGEVKGMEDVEAAARPLMRALAPVTNFVDLDENFYPPKAAWRGSPPVAVDTAQAKRELAALERQEREAREAEGSLKVLRENVDRAATALHEAQTAAIEFVVPDVEALQAAHDEAYRAYMAGSRAVREAEAKLRELQDAKRDLETRAREAQARIERAKDRVAEYRRDLDELAANNVLLRKLRGLKLKVNDRLWNQVLSAASAYFSQMRGEPSVITKDGDGFKVNGQNARALSGSTQDLLGIATRIALTKTFVPHAPFVALDEPAHGCSEGRTAKVLGFLAGIGVGQCLLATHDPISESVADHVIHLGE